MDDIQTLSSLAYDRTLALKNLEERQMARMMITYAGGIWLCTTELMSMLLFYEQFDEVVLLDSNKIPRKVKPLELTELLGQKHQEVLNDWYIEYQKLSKIRNAKNAIA